MRIVVGETVPEVSATELNAMGSWSGLKGDLGSWTDDKKEEALKTQVKFTQELVDSIRLLRVPPKLFICASEVYGCSIISVSYSIPARSCFMRQPIRLTQL